MQASPKVVVNESAVSSVIGTVLMLAITITVFGGLSVFVLSSMQKDEPPPHAEMAALVDGDRALLLHRGGEPIELDTGFLLINVEGFEVRVDLTELANQTSDGRTWRIGETLCISGPGACLLNGREVVGIVVVAAGNLYLDEGERGDFSLCPFDDVAPAVGTWLQVPVNVATTTVGSIAVTAAVTDDCAGVDLAVAPTLHYRINNGSNPAFTSLGAMASAGASSWTGTLPSQSWNLLGGKTLEYFATAMQDLNGNVATVNVTQSDLIDIITLTNYVSTNTPTLGSVASFAAAQNASDGGAEALVSEGGTTGSPGSGGPTKFSGSTAATGGAVSHTSVLTSDDVRATLDTTGDWIEVTGFDLPANAVNVTTVVIGYEGRQDASGGTSPTTRLDYKIGAGAYSNGSSITESATSDTDRTRTLSGTFTVANVESMTIRVFHVTDTNRNPEVDHLFVTVAYTTPPPVTYSLDVQMDWVSVPDGSSETLEFRYQIAGDSFTLQVWNGVSYTSRATLNAATPTTISYVLTAAEYNGGAPRIRVVDVTPTGTAQGTVLIDYARIVTA